MTPLYLSRLSLCRDPSLAALERVLVPVEDGERTGAAHRLIWTAFADDGHRKRDFLWRQDDKRRWLVLSQRLPDNRHQLFDIETKPFDPLLEKGQRLTFALRANAAVTRKDKNGQPKRSDIVMDRLRAFSKGERASERHRIAREAGREWLIAQGATAGFRVDRAGVTAYRTEKIPRARRGPIELGVIDFEGEISVEEPQLFLSALAAGFGKAKAFGCGLMLIRRCQ
jgi:CRISPR system Cascade subunit CasE